MARMKHLEVERISLVDSPSTGFRFLVIKREGGSPMDPELLKLLEEYGEKEALDKLADAEVPEGAQKMVKAALLIAKDYGDSLPADLKKSVGQLALGALLSVVVESEGDKEGEEKGEKKPDKQAKKEEDEEGKPKDESAADEAAAANKDLAEAVSKIGDRLDKLDGDLDGAFEQLATRLDQLGVRTGVSKQAGGDSEGGEEGTKWPSFAGKQPA